MARNKHPEETIDLILDVSLRLFMEKGYEGTSIQDIVDELGGLSKGAIYHHFKSKEDIFVAVTDRMAAASNRSLAEIRDRSDLSGKEKIKLIIKSAICRPVQKEIVSVAPDLCDDPKLFVSFLRETIDDTIPNYILPIIDQGVAEGSIQTKYPEQLAELITISLNIWLNPLVFHSSEEELLRKLTIFEVMMNGFGLDIIDEELIASMRELTAIHQSRKSVDRRR